MGSFWILRAQKESVRMVNTDYGVASIGQIDEIDETDAAEESILAVHSIDLCLQDNHDDHHTSHFFNAKESLIVRRGKPFRLRMHFNRSFNPNYDAISFIFTVADAKKPNPRHGTLINIDNIDNLGDPYKWGACIETYEDNTLTVLIKPAVTCPVTEWKLDIDTQLLGDDSKTYSVPIPIYVLFNPWCSDDQVYLEDRDKRKEYVMHDTTLIWRGSYNRMRPSVWKLGQFERHVLECSIKLLGTVGCLPAAYRGDSVRVARALSAAVNSSDDNGIVVGKWHGDFSDGISPIEWLGSTDILQQFYKTQEPVKFGQCWVFAGVLATIARALGIPSRIVTCFSAAHDAHASLTVDFVLDANNKKIDPETSDSIWNFHVWNELWMDRPDLDIGPHGSYAGWQVVDATPQELSGGKYRVGPTSVVSVKHGEILRPFDCGYVFSEVNADRIYWRYNDHNQSLKMLSKNTMQVGHLISTKSVLKWDREDITDSYKFAETTEEERNVMIKALKQSQHSYNRHYLNDFKEVEFDMSLKDDIKIGEDFSVIVKVTNKSKEEVHTATGKLSCDAVLYTGGAENNVKSVSFEVEVQPDSSEYVRMEVIFEEYFTKLTSQADFVISCFGKVKDTDYEYFTQDDFRVRKPDIKISFQGNMVSHQPVNVTMCLANPLPIPLSNGMFYVAGPGIENSLRSKVMTAEIPVGCDAVFTFEYTPPYAGCGTLLAKFSSKELNDVDGYLYYAIESRSE